MHAKGRMNATYWPGELVMLVEFYWIERISATEIARRIGKTKNAVIGFTNLHGFVYRAGFNSAFKERDGLPLSPRVMQEKERRRQKEAMANFAPVERLNGAIRGSTLPPLESLENTL